MNNEQTPTDQMTVYGLFSMYADGTDSCWHNLLQLYASEEAALTHQIELEEQNTCPNTSYDISLLSVK
jgi:hypothetical protein